MTTPQADIHSFPPEQHPEKHKTRTTTLDLLRDPECPTNLFYDGHLTRDWMELCGDAPDATCGLLLDEGVLAPDHGRYIGVNTNQGILDRNATHYNDDRTEWRCGDMSRLLLDLDDPTLRNIGVLVFDGFRSPSNLHLESILLPMFAFAQSQQQRLGQFLLVINLALRGNASAPLEKAKRQFEAIVHKHCGVQVPKQAFTTYRSRVIPMQLLRLSYGW